MSEKWVPKVEGEDKARLIQYLWGIYDHTEPVSADAVLVLAALDVDVEKCARALCGAAVNVQRWEDCRAAGRAAWRAEARAVLEAAGLVRADDERG